jgi:hypothetical protein
MLAHPPRKDSRLEQGGGGKCFTPSLRRRRTEAGACLRISPPPAPPAKIWMWCLSGGPKTFGPSSRAFYLQNDRFSKWRNPDSNRGHHDFQICPETYG